MVQSAALDRELEEAPECPAMLAHVFEWFLELSSSRGSGGFGPNPVGYGLIADWSRLMRIRPTPFEVRCLRDLDGVFLNVHAERKPVEPKKP